MAETVDLIRDYCKQFIIHPMNEKLEKNEFYFNEKFEKLEKQFIEKIQQLENLIENNNKKTGQLDEAVDNQKQNQNRLEGKIAFINTTNEKKIEEIEVRLNDIKPSKDLTEIENKFQQLTESFKQTEIQSKEMAKNIRNIEVDWSKKLDKTIKVIDQLQLETKNNFEETQHILKQKVEKLKTVEIETKQTIAQLELKVEITSKAIEKINSDENKQLKKVKKETKKKIEIFSNGINEKYDKCIQQFLRNEVQLKTMTENNERNFKTDLNKMTEDIAQLQLKIETTSKSIEKIKSDEIKPLKQLETQIDVLKMLTKQINFENELEKVIKLIIKTNRSNY
ncbi:hypothetical protein CHUAL_000083 [Chamberlinius hualienensis]